MTKTDLCGFVTNQNYQLARMERQEKTQLYTIGY